MKVQDVWLKHLFFFLFFFFPQPSASSLNVPAVPCEMHIPGHQIATFASGGRVGVWSVSSTHGGFDAALRVVHHKLSLAAQASWVYLRLALKNAQQQLRQFNKGINELATIRTDKIFYKRWLPSSVFSLQKAVSHPATLSLLFKCTDFAPDMMTNFMRQFIKSADLVSSF